MSAHTTSGTATSSGNTYASRVYAIRLFGDPNPGTGGHTIDFVADKVDTIFDNLVPDGDAGTGATGSWVYFNLQSPSAGIPVKEFSINVTGTVTWELMFEPA